MKEQKVDYILSIGADLIAKNGFHQVGLQQVLDEAKIPKGSFYYYFKSKEDFGLQVIDYYTNQNVEFLKSFLEDKSKTPRDRIFGLFNAVGEVYVKQQFAEGCLLGNCSLELSAQKSIYAENIEKSFRSWEKLFIATIKEGQEEGDIKQDKKPEDLASFILNTWEGALVRMKASKSNRPLELLIDFMEVLL